MGSVRIAAFPNVFATVLPRLLRRFRTLHPGIDVIALEADDCEAEGWLEARSSIPESTLPENWKGLRVVAIDPPLFRRSGLMAALGHQLSLDLLRA